MISLIVFTLLVWGITLASSLGLSAWVLPRGLRHSPYLLLILPAIGLGQIAFFGTYALMLGYQAKVGVFLSLGVSLLLIVLAGLMKRPALVSDFRAILPAFNQRRLQIFVIVVCIIGIFALLLLPGLSHPWRVGIDQAGNAITIEYFRTGGTLPKLRALAEDAFGYPLLRMANTDYYAQSNNYAPAMRLDVETATGFVLSWFRFGYMAMQAGLMQCTGFGPAILFQLPILIFSAFAACGLAAHFFEKRANFSAQHASFAAMALVFGCINLNLLCEGQHANFMVMPFSFLAFMAWIEIRDTQSDAPWPKEWMILLAVSIAMMLCVYSEAFSVTCAVFGLTSLFDILSRRQLIIKHHFLAAGAVVAGLFACGYFAYLYLIFIVHFIGMVSGGLAGYPQPHWPLLSDMLGLTNLYWVSGFKTEFMAKLIDRGQLESLIVQLASLIALWLMLGRHGRSAQPLFKPGLAAGVIVGALLIIGLKNYLVYNFTNNYLLYKTSSMVGFPLVGWFLITLHHAFDQPAFKPILRRSGFGVLLFGMLLTSAGYLITYRAEAERTGPLAAELTDWYAEHGAIDPLILTTESSFDFGPIMLGGAAPLNWLNFSQIHGRIIPHFAPHIGKPIYVLSLRRGSHPPCVSAGPGQTVLLKNSDFVLIDSGVKLTSDLAEKLKSQLEEAKTAGVGMETVWSKLRADLKLECADTRPWPYQ